MTNIRFRHIFQLLLCAVSVCFCACSTGIETTGKIKMSRADRRELQASEEEILISKISPAGADTWKPGKRFKVTDGRASLIYDRIDDQQSSMGTAAGSDRGSDLTGEEFRFDGVSTRMTPGGDSIVILEFTDSKKRRYQYNTGRHSLSSISDITVSDMPMLIDLDIVQKADSLLSGRTLWTLSRLRIGEEDSNVYGRKYEKVKVENVEVGNKLFPLIINLITDAGGRERIYMNVRNRGGSGAESRTFESLFSLTDPRLRYPSITDEHWQLIMDGEVAIGMTKDECRLSLGNPADVDTGRNWSSVMDIWQYKDGTFLQFTDGLLSGYRH